MESRTRLIAFLFGCIPVRLLFTFIAYKATPQLLFWLGLLALVPVFGWLRIMLWAPRDSGIEAGGKIWWKEFRPIHTILWMLFALQALRKQHTAWIFLLVDAILGLVLYTLHQTNMLAFR